MTREYWGYHSTATNLYSIYIYRQILYLIGWVLTCLDPTYGCKWDVQTGSKSPYVQMENLLYVAIFNSELFSHYHKVHSFFISHQININIPLNHRQIIKKSNSIHHKIPWKIIESTINFYGWWLGVVSIYPICGPDPLVPGSERHASASKSLAETGFD